MIRLALLGLGRMGREVFQLAKSDERFELVFGIEKNTNDLEGISIPIISLNEVEQAIEKHMTDIVIDYSHPSATMEVAPILLKNNISLVVCTTGFNQEEQEKLIGLANNSEGALLLAPNITPGINLLMLFSKIASNVLKDYDIQILDYHFKSKKDKPSGTARKLAKQLEYVGKEVDTYGIRAGGIIGKHKILFAGQEDQIEISHETYSTRLFARSALNAAALLNGKKGYHEINDILNIN